MRRWTDQTTHSPDKIFYPRTGLGNLDSVRPVPGSLWLPHPGSDVWLTSDMYKKCVAVTSEQDQDENACIYWKSRNECGVWQSLMSSLWQLHLPHYRCKPYPASHIVTWHMRWGGDAWSVDDWCRLYPVSHSFIRLLTFTFLSHSVQHLESSQDFHHLHKFALVRSRYAKVCIAVSLSCSAAVWCEELWPSHIPLTWDPATHT